MLITFSRDFLNINAGRRLIPMTQSFMRELMDQC
jgi:hypothetical protein